MVTLDTRSAVDTRPAGSLLGHLATVLSGRLLVVLWGGLLVVDIGASLPLAPLWTGVALVLLVMGCSVALPERAALLVAVVGWLLVNGFVTHQLGELAYAGTSDVCWLTALVLAASIGSRLR